MPTYEYRCADCGRHFDIVQSFTDDSLTECPECGGRLKKVFGSVGISFKGSGFYVNDSGSAKHPSPPHSTSDSSSATTSSDSTSSGDGTSSSSNDSASGSSSSSSSDSKASAAAE